MTDKQDYIGLISMDCSYEKRRFRFHFYQDPRSPGDSFITLIELKSVDVYQEFGVIEEWKESFNRINRTFKGITFPKESELLSMIKELVQQYPKSPRNK